METWTRDVMRVSGAESSSGDGERDPTRCWPLPGNSVEGKLHGVAQCESRLPDSLDLFPETGYDDPTAT